MGDLKVPAVNLSGCIPYIHGWCMGYGWSRKHPTIFVGFPLRKEEAGNLSQALGKTNTFAEDFRDDGKLGVFSGAKKSWEPRIFGGHLNLILVMFILGWGLNLVINRSSRSRSSL